LKKDWLYVKGTKLTVYSQSLNKHLKTLFKT
jgi:hypothetical protein